MPVNCPNCATEMAAMTLEAHLAAPVTIDACASCQGFWFDKFESLKLSAASTLKLIKFIGEHSLIKASLSAVLRCPRCTARLKLTRDMQRSTRFSYWRCPKDHGRFIGFFDFLREKNFIRPLSPQQIEELRRNVQTVNCSNCGAPIDLAAGSLCAHCGSPISMLDMKQPQELLAQLRQAAEPQPMDPALPVDLALAKRHVELLFAPPGSSAEWWDEASTLGVLEAGLSAVARWLTKSGI